MNFRIAFKGILSDDNKESYLHFYPIISMAIELDHCQKKT